MCQPLVAGAQKKPGLDRVKGTKPKDSSNKSRVEFVHTNRQKDRQKERKNTECSKTTTPIQGLPEENPINKKDTQTETYRQTDRLVHRQTD